MFLRAPLLLALLSFAGCIIHQAAPAAPLAPAPQSVPATAPPNVSEASPPPTHEHHHDGVHPISPVPATSSETGTAPSEQVRESAPRSGTIRAMAMCTRMGCPNGSCCNTCRLRLSFQPDGATSDDAVLLEGHGCRADGCGEITGCDLQEGPFTLPEGTTQQADGSLLLP